MSAVLLAACDPPQQLTLTGGLDPGSTVSGFLPPEGDLSLSNQLDGIITNASYVGDLEKRVYLLSAPIWPDGASGATRDVSTLALPLPTVSLGTSSTDFSGFDTTKWRGARAYDIGLCSQHTPWSEIAQQLTEGIMEKLTERPESIADPEHVGVAEAFPILHGNGSTEVDRIGFKMSFQASFIGERACAPIEPLCVDAGCHTPRVALSFEVVLGTKPGAYVEPRAGSGCSPIALGEPIPNANDPTASIQNLVVSIESAGDCVLGADRTKVEASLRATFDTELPAGLASALRDALLLPAIGFARPGTGEIPGRLCSCDSECTEGASALPNPFGAGTGARHRCRMEDTPHRCGFQLELDRFEVRPEGLEIVLAENESDPQAAVLVDVTRRVSDRGLCNGNRAPRVASDEAPLLGLLLPGTFAAPTP